GSRWAGGRLLRRFIHLRLGAAGRRYPAASLCRRHRPRHPRNRSWLPRLWAAAVSARARNRVVRRPVAALASVRFSDRRMARRTLLLHRRFREARAALPADRRPAGIGWKLHPLVVGADPLSVYRQR